MATRAVLFDYGLTLVSFEFPRECLLGVLRRARAWLGPGAPDAEWLLFHVLHPVEAALESFGEDEVPDYLEFYGHFWTQAGLEPTPEVLHRILDLEQRCWDASVRVAPGALDLLDRLRARGLKLGLASNAPFPPEMMLRQVAGNGIGPRLDGVVFSSMVGRRKPAPELYRAALQALGVSAEEALYVGDRRREDYDGPRSVGMRAVLCRALARGEPPPEVPTIDRLDQLLAYL